jgi:DNA-binding NarL/FixJ family response regulator
MSCSGPAEPAAGSPRAQGLRVAVADDQTVVREGLVTILGLLPGVEVVGQASDGEEALAVVRSAHPDVVLMDLRMPRCDGVEATRRIRREYPETEVVVLTTYDDDASILAALAAGARGYLTKDAASEQIARALHAADAGQSVLSAEVQAKLVAAAQSGQGSFQPTPAGTSLPDFLTAREGDVLRLIAAGRSNGEIAAELYVSEATVKTHINHIFAKTGARDRAQAVRYAYDHGLVDRPAY